MVEPPLQWRPRILAGVVVQPRFLMHGYWATYRRTTINVRQNGKYSVHKCAIHCLCIAAKPRSLERIDDCTTEFPHNLGLKEFIFLDSTCACNRNTITSTRPTQANKQCQCQPTINQKRLAPNGITSRRRNTAASILSVSDIRSLLARNRVCVESLV